MARLYGWALPATFQWVRLVSQEHAPKRRLPEAAVSAARPSLGPLPAPLALRAPWPGPAEPPTTVLPTPQPAPRPPSRPRRAPLVACWSRGIGCPSCPRMRPAPAPRARLLAARRSLRARSWPSSWRRRCRWGRLASSACSPALPAPDAASNTCGTLFCWPPPAKFHLTSLPNLTPHDPTTTAL